MGEWDYEHLLPPGWYWDGDHDEYDWDGDVYRHEDY